MLVTSPRTGKSYEIEWDHPDPPNEEDLSRILDIQEPVPTIPQIPQYNYGNQGEGIPTIDIPNRPPPEDIGEPIVDENQILQWGVDTGKITPEEAELERAKLNPELKPPELIRDQFDEGVKTVGEKVKDFFLGSVPFLHDAGQELSGKILESDLFGGAGEGEFPVLHPDTLEAFGMPRGQEQAFFKGALAGGVEGLSDVLSPADLATFGTSLAAKGVASIPKLSKNLVRAAETLDLLSSEVGFISGAHETAIGAAQGDIEQTGKGLFGTAASLAGSIPIRNKHGIDNIFSKASKNLDNLEWGPEAGAIRFGNEDPPTFYGLEEIIGQYIPGEELNVIPERTIPGKRVPGRDILNKEGQVIKRIPDQVIADKTIPAENIEAQLRRLLKDKPGVSEEELEFTNFWEEVRALEESGKTKITKKELEDILRRNEIQVTEHHREDAPKELEKQVTDLEVRIGELNEKQAELDDDLHWREHPPKVKKLKKTELDEVIKKRSELSEELRKLKSSMPRKPKWSQVRFQSGRLVTEMDEKAQPKNREIIFNYPKKENEPPMFEASEGHWDERIDRENQLGWIRGQEFIDEEGKKVFVVDEIQSDQDIAGRMHGWQKPVDKIEEARLKGEVQKYKERLEKAKIKYEKYDRILNNLDGKINQRSRSHYNKLYETQEKMYYRLKDKIEQDQSLSRPEKDRKLDILYDKIYYDRNPAYMRNDKVLKKLEEKRNKLKRDQDKFYRDEYMLAEQNYDQFSDQLEALKGKGAVRAPLLRETNAFMLKRLARWATDNGFDRIAWTTGRQQNVRYKRDPDKKEHLQHYDEIIPKIFKGMGAGETKKLPIPGRYDAGGLKDDSPAMIEYRKKMEIYENFMELQQELLRLQDEMSGLLRKKTKGLSNYSNDPDVPGIRPGEYRDAEAEYRQIEEELYRQTRAIRNEINRIQEETGVSRYYKPQPPEDPSHNFLHSVDLSPEFKEYVRGGLPLYGLVGKKRRKDIGAIGDLSDSETRVISYKGKQHHLTPRQDKLWQEANDKYKKVMAEGTGRDKREAITILNKARKDIIEGVDLPEESGIDLSADEDQITLYRVETSTGEKNAPDWVKGHSIYENASQASGRWFTDDPEEARYYLQDNPGAKISTITLPKVEAERYRVSNTGGKPGGKNTPENPNAFSRRPDKEFFLPKELADKRTPGKLPDEFEDFKLVDPEDKGSKVEDIEDLELVEPYQYPEIKTRGRKPAQGPKPPKLPRAFDPPGTKTEGQKPKTAKDMVLDTLGLWKAVKSIDPPGMTSAALRQGLLTSAGHPIKASAALVNSFLAYFSQKHFDAVSRSIDTHPYAPLFKEYINLSDPNGTLVQQEEQFLTRFSKNIPLIKQSERAYITYLNKLRADVFSDGVRAIASRGQVTEKELKALGNVINAFTGRGRLGSLEKIVPELNVALWSPRFQASRVESAKLTLQALTPQKYGGLPKQARKEALRSIMATAAFAYSALALAEMNGAEVNKDPNSSDFLKIKVDNTRYDILGGFQPWMRIVHQTATGGVTSTRTGKKYKLAGPTIYGVQRGTKVRGKELTQGDNLLRYLRQKASPLAGNIADLYSGEEYPTGRKIEKFSDVMTWDDIRPMFMSDIVDLYKEGDQDIQDLAVSGTLSGLGVGVTTIPK